MFAVHAANGAWYYTHIFFPLVTPLPPDVRTIKAIDAPIIIPRSSHIISRAHISDGALKVLSRLKDAGYDAYLVGGCVRDLLLGRKPKDFDIATDALPEQVSKLFRNSRLIGRRFRLAHIRFGREIVEVATFRGVHSGECEDGVSQDGRIVRDNVYSSDLADDAWRRDFTVNALYYSIDDFSVIDYTGGMDDLRTGILHLIGDPQLRYQEDPVRMLRAVRFAAKLGFRIHPESEAPILQLGHLLENVSSARLFEEVLKLFMGANALQTLQLMRHYGLFGHLFPQTEASLKKNPHSPHVLELALINTEARIAEGKPVTPAFLFAALLWEPVRQTMEQLQPDPKSELQVLHATGDKVLLKQLSRVALPKRFSVPMREIWTLQPKFRQRSGKRPLRFLEHPRFRAAYDFMLLRVITGEEDQELADWWTDIQTISAAERETVADNTKPESPPPTRTRRRRR